MSYFLQQIRKKNFDLKNLMKREAISCIGEITANAEIIEFVTDEKIRDFRAERFPSFLKKFSHFRKKFSKKVLTSDFQVVLKLSTVRRKANEKFFRR